MTRHEYRTSVRWTGNGAGTTAYDAYSRDHEVGGPGKSAAIPCSSDAHFRGTAGRYNPEELLVASLSTCHMLWYLHLCAIGGVVVIAYEDEATGEMIEEEEGGLFTGVLLRPRVTVTVDSDAAKALHLHEEARRLCFIARSVRFPVTHKPVIERLTHSSGLS